MNGGQLVALAACLAVMVGVAVWVHVGPARWQPVTGPVAAALLLLVGRAAGLSWAQLGLGSGTVVPGLVWGGAAVACVALVYAVGLALPATRGLFRDARHRVGARTTVHRAGLVVPLGDGRLRGGGLPRRAVGAARVGPRCGLGHGGLCGAVRAVARAARHRGRPGERAERRGGARGSLLRQVAGTVAFTAVAGVVFGVLRDQSGSLLAPGLLHWATNGLGIVAAALAWRWSAEAEAEAPDPVE